MGQSAGRSVDDPLLRAIIRANEGRKPGWVEIKYQRMNADLFAFFRGTDHLFAADWPDFRPIEPGPSILICGDLHLENFGVYRADDGKFVFDLNDFDEATIAPCSIDLVRCATSILLAAQVWKLTPIQAIRTVLGFVDRYRSTITRSLSGPRPQRPRKRGRGGRPDPMPGPGGVASHRDLLDTMTRVDKKEGERTIRKSADRFPELSEGKFGKIARAVDAYGRSKPDPSTFRMLDASGRIAGIGSLGVRRYVVLVAGDGSKFGERLLDIKEACPSAIAGLAERPGPEAWKTEAGRVVDAQRHLHARPSADLGVFAMGRRCYRIREMIPDENRARIDRFRRDASRLREAVEVAGRVVARSQIRGARSGDGDRTEELARWAAGPGLDAVLTSAVRFAEKTREDFVTFRKGRATGEI